MILGQVELLYVQKIKFPFIWRKFDSPLHLYIKDYDVENPHLIQEIKVKVLDKYIPGCTLLIIYNNTHYWCPVLEEIYKTSERNRPNIKYSLGIHKKKNNKISVTFKFKKRPFKTYEVKEVKILLKDVEKNENN